MSRDCKIEFRATRKEKDGLLRLAEDNGLSLSEFIRTRTNEIVNIQTYLDKKMTDEREYMYNELDSIRYLITNNK